MRRKILGAGSGVWRRNHHSIGYKDEGSGPSIPNIREAEFGVLLDLSQVQAFCELLPINEIHRANYSTIRCCSLRLQVLLYSPRQILYIK